MNNTEMELDETHEGCSWDVIDYIGNGSEANPQFFYVADLHLVKYVFPALFTIHDNDPFITFQDLHLPSINPISSIIFDEFQLKYSITDPAIDLPVFNFLPSALH